VLGSLAVLALAAAPAWGGVRKAGDVLPPGQSGFVPASGLASGTGSPHLTDQVDLFLNFQFKPHTFGQPGTEESPRPGVKIVRDQYGVPAITGDSADDLWFGAGYAVAQDRLFQLELFRLATTGHLAERVGSEYVDDDELVRRDFYEPFELEIQLSKLPPELRRRFDSYRDGINAWIQETRDDPNKLPGEFLATAGGPPRDWTVLDSAAIGVYLARTVPSDNGEELNNARALKALGPKLFDRLLPLRIPGQVATVPRSSGLFPSMPGRTRKEERRAYARSRRFLAATPLPEQPKASSASAAASGALRGQLGRRGSNMWAIRSSRNTVATIFNGPQLGFQIPELFVEMELHGPGIDIRGVTAPGVPLVAIGHNGRVAWGFTSGLSDEDDLYVEKLEGEDRYVYKGETRDMACRDEVIRWGVPPANLLAVTGGEAPDTNSGEKTVKICRTVHGPVQERAEGVAFARRYAIWGREIETLEGLAALEQAKTVFDVDKAMARVTWNENLMAADEQGNIGYWHPGLHPLRPEGWDERLPYPGTGEAEWRAFLPVKRRPYVINPRQGYLFNWNNIPSAGWTTGDGPARERLLGGFHRAALLRRAVARAYERGGGYDVTAEVDKITGTTAQQRIPATRKLKAARKGARGNAKIVLDTILAWDGNYHRTDAEGKVDPGVAAWDAFGKALFEVALGSRQPKDALALLRHGAGSSHQQEFDVQEVFGLRTLGPRGYRQAAALAFEAVRTEFESDDPAKWRRPRPMYSTGAQGAASFPDIPFFDRGTWQQVVELGP